MSVIDLDVVDMVATKPGSDEVRLVIADQLTWDDPGTHRVALQEKINVYIAFIETDQIWSSRQESLPDDPTFIIVISRAHKPPPGEQWFYDALRDGLAKLGIGFELMVPSECCDT
jgi:hypothetical protein